MVNAEASVCDNGRMDDTFNESYDQQNLLKKRLKKEPINALEVTESLGFQTHRRKMRKPWTKREDELLRRLVNESLVSLGHPNGIESIKSIQQSNAISKRIVWDKLAKKFQSESRKPADVKKRWVSSLDPNLKKGKWTPEEDQLLLNSYEKYGPQWLKISYALENRTEDQCAKRYIEVLDPSTKDRLRPWNLEEDLLLISKVKKYGTKWRQISSEMDARPSLTCRNRWRKIITLVVRGDASESIREAVETGNEITLKGNGDNNGIENSDEHSKKPLEEPLKEPLNEPREGLRDDPIEDPMEETSEEPIEGTSEEPIETQFEKSAGKQQENIGQSMIHASTKDFVQPLKSKDSTPIMFDIVPETNQRTSLLDSVGNEKSPKNQKQESTYSLGRANATPEPTINRAQSPLLLNHPSQQNLLMEAVKKNSPLPPPTSFLPFPTIDLRKPQPETSVDWKFCMNEMKGNTVSSGVISNTDLVKQLIQNAKANGLKISIHQHIHNHYVGQRQVSPPPTSLHSQRNIYSVTNQSEMMKAESPGLSDFETDFLSRTPNYAYWDIEEGSPLIQIDERMQRFYHHYHHHHHDTPAFNNNSYLTDSLPVIRHPPSSNGSYSQTSPTGNEIREIEPGRHSHFNYLPPTLKPQLGSSDSPRNHDIGRLLNPSPPTNSIHKRKKYRKRQKGEHTNRYNGSVGTTPVEDSDIRGSKAKVTPSTISSVTEEEGVDFWESLRTLGAVNPIEKSPEIEHFHSPSLPHLNSIFNSESHESDMPTGYDAIFKFFEQKRDTDTEVGNDEPIEDLAFNPS